MKKTSLFLHVVSIVALGAVGACEKEKEPLPTTSSCYTVSFNLDADEAQNRPNDQTVCDSRTANRPATDPVRDGHLFIGWYADPARGDAFNFATRIKADLVLHAKWVATKSIADFVTLPGLDAHLTNTLLRLYDGGASVVIRYLKPGGTGDGIEWATADGNLAAALDRIADAGPDKVYLLLLAGGAYPLAEAIAMKDYTALIGGFTEGQDNSGLFDRNADRPSRLSGEGKSRVFANQDIGITALLYGVTVEKGSAGNETGGGMYNLRASPSVVNVTFLSNTSRDVGGGMHNDNLSSPILINVSFSGNLAEYGGGMYNSNASPLLANVTFAGNTAGLQGGGMSNELSSPILIGTTFVNNASGAGAGAGMHNDNDGASGPIVVNGLFWNNEGGNDIHMFNDQAGGAENITLYNSVLQGGTGAIGENRMDAIPYNLVSEEVRGIDPQIGTLADNGGEVPTIAIGVANWAGANVSDWPKDRGLYALLDNRGVFYYSEDRQTWYTRLGADGLSEAMAPPPDAIEVNATDARGYGRDGRPEPGAYEYRGTPP